MGILNMLGKTIKFTGLGLGAKEFADYVEKMKGEGKNPYSFTNFKKEYGDPLAEKIKNAYDKTVDKKAMGGMMEARKKGMGLKMNTGGMVPSEFKGFSKLPESVQENMSPALAKKYNKGGAVKKRVVKRKPKSRGTGAAVKGTKFKGVF